MKAPDSIAVPLAPAANLFRQLSELAEGGLSAAEAVAVLTEDEDIQSVGLGSIVAALQRDLAQNDSLATALSRHAAVFGVETVALIRAAEERNALPSCLALLADDCEKRLQFRKGLPVLLFWPLFLLGFLALIASILMIFVIPAFKQVFVSFGADLPAPTLAVIAISDLMVAYWWILFPLLVALPFGVAVLRRREAAGMAIDGAFLKVPGVRRFLLKLLVGRMVVLLAGAAANGIPLPAVVSYLRSTLGNRYLRNVIAQLEQDLAQGLPLPAAWRRQPLLPRGVARVMEIGERSGRLALAMGRAAQRYSLEAAQSVVVFRSVLLVSTYVLAGAIVGLTVIAMYLPIFKLGSLA